METGEIQIASDSEKTEKILTKDSSIEGYEKILTSKKVIHEKICSFIKSIGIDSFCLVTSSNCEEAEDTTDLCTVIHMKDSHLAKAMAEMLDKNPELGEAFAYESMIRMKEVLSNYKKRTIDPELAMLIKSVSL